MKTEPARRGPILFILNPRSGYHARNPHLRGRIYQFIAAHHLQAEVRLTERRAHATALAREAAAAGAQLVVAVGGDGTINEVASGLVGTTTPLGLIPCGSGNGLGRHLGITGPNEAAFAALLHGPIREVDTGIVAGHPFFNVMGLGFDVEIARRFNRLTRRGLRGYVATTVRTWARRRAVEYVIHEDDHSWRVPAMLLAVANSDQYGNNCYIAPGARVDDGQLDLVAIERVSLPGAVRLGLALFRGRLDRCPHVRRWRGPRFVIERERAATLHTDGELHPAPPRLVIEVRSRSLRIVVPSGSPAASGKNGAANGI